MKAPRVTAIGATIAGIMVGFGAGQASAGILDGAIQAVDVVRDDESTNMYVKTLGDSANQGVGNLISPIPIGLG